MKEHDRLYVPLIERLKSIPGFFGIRLDEQPRFDLLAKDGEIELRRYWPQVRAILTVPARPFAASREEAFHRLAAYAFGDNSSEREIGMTAPVLLQHLKQDWTMSFILPRRFTLDSAPRPHDGGIRIAAVPVQTVASLEYSGNNSPEKIEVHALKLMDWVHDGAIYRNEGEAYSAQYDAPWALPFVKRNEVHQVLRALH